MRWNSGDLPTDRPPRPRGAYTGQRREASLGLVDYGARMYDPALGRFLQADTLVPSPSNPQAFNRYLYVLGNPLKYTDPSGHYSQGQIQASFGVDTWEEVLGFFEEGGSLEGKWGWLEILRRAEDGSELYQGVDYSLADGDVATWQQIGYFRSAGDRISLSCFRNLPASELLQLEPSQWTRWVDQQIVGAEQGEFSGIGEAHDIYRLGGENGFITHVGYQHNAVRVNPAINYPGLAADAVGFVTCPIGGAAVQRIVGSASRNISSTSWRKYLTG